MPLRNMKTVSVISAPSPNVDTPPLPVTNPPVDTVLNANAMLSTTDTPCNNNNTTITSVTAIYILHILDTLRASRGCSLRPCVPENSALYNPPADTPSLRKKATTNNNSPNPPIHCVIARYTNNPGPSASGFANTDDPVVVNPLNDSNNASTNPIPPAKRYGSTPLIGTTNHTVTAIQMLSHSPISYSAPLPTKFFSNNPITNINTPATTIATICPTATSHSPLTPTKTVTPTGNTIPAASHTSSTPVTLATNR